MLTRAGSLMLWNANLSAPRAPQIGFSDFGLGQAKLPSAFRLNLRGFIG